MKKLAFLLLALAASALPAFAEDAVPKRSLADGFGKFRIGVHFNLKAENDRPGARLSPPNFASGKNFPDLFFPLDSPVAGCKALRVYFDRKKRIVALALVMGTLDKEEFQNRWKEIAALYNLSAREGVSDAFDEIDPVSGKPTGFALHVSEEKNLTTAPKKQRRAQRRFTEATESASTSFHGISRRSERRRVSQAERNTPSCSSTKERFATLTE